MLMAVELTADQAYEFFERCQKAGAVTEAARAKILTQMVKEKKAKRAWVTNRTKKQVIKDLAKDYKVLHVEKK